MMKKTRLFLCLLSCLAGTTMRASDWQEEDQFIWIMLGGSQQFYCQARLNTTDIVNFTQRYYDSELPITYQGKENEVKLNSDTQLSTTLNEVMKNTDDAKFVIRNREDLKGSSDLVEGFIVQGMWGLRIHSKHYMLYGTYYCLVLGLVVVLATVYAPWERVRGYFARDKEDVKGRGGKKKQ